MHYLSAWLNSWACGAANAIVAATAFDLEQLDGIPTDKPGRVRFIFARSVQRNRWYRKLVSIVAEGLGMHPGVLHAEIKFKAAAWSAASSCIKGIRHGGAELESSTAFNTMDESRFGRYVDLAIEILFNDYLPGVERSAVFKEVEDFVGPRPA